jgi:hypothetical protein
MALWGNNDAVTSAGIVTLAYTSNDFGGTALTVNGNGTAFNAVGSAQTGDVIRFGLRNGVDGAVYFGDAVISGITSATQLTIGSTSGLSGAAIAGTSFYISQLPSYTTLSPQWSNNRDGDKEYTFYQGATIASSAGDSGATGDVRASGVGTAFISLDANIADLQLSTSDTFVNDGNNILITGVGSCTVLTDTIGIALTDQLPVVAPAGINLGDTVIDYLNSDAIKTITGIAATEVTLDGQIGSNQYAAGTKILFKSNFVVSLASTITADIAAGTAVTFNRLAGGYDSQVYGIAVEDMMDVNSPYRTNGTGWVGVTTYMDTGGNLRVKSEILVAIGNSGSTAGITTGADSILYPTDA